SRDGATPLSANDERTISMMVHRAPGVATDSPRHRDRRVTDGHPARSAGKLPGSIWQAPAMTRAGPGVARSFRPRGVRRPSLRPIEAVLTSCNGVRPASPQAEPEARNAEK